MRTVLESLIPAGEKGIELTSSNGDVRLVFPVLSCYVADYPEQCLVTCTKYGTCVKCKAKATQLGNKEPCESRTQSWTESVLQEGQAKANGTQRAFYTHCMGLDVAGTVYRPFWQGFPFTDIHRAITPDVLHQLYQGVFKHLVAWCQLILSPQQLDQRIRCLPPGYGLRHFKNGISALSQISGPERKNMAKILLGCLIGSIPQKAIAAIAGLLDFIYIAQYTTHDTTTLQYLKDALKQFHDNRDYFIELNIRKDFNIPKFHSLLHYVEAIEQFGTTDNYNTELFERLHIDFAKLGWRATNQRDEFPQMIRWLSRHEKIVGLETFHMEQQNPVPPTHTKPKNPGITISKKPNFTNRHITLIEEKHCAPDFSYYLKVYLNKISRSPVSNRHLEQQNLPFYKLNTYNMFRFNPQSLDDDDDTQERDIVKALPKSQELPGGRFDTVVVMVKDNAESTGVEGLFSIL